VLANPQRRGRGDQERGRAPRGHGEHDADADAERRREELAQLARRAAGREQGCESYGREEAGRGEQEVSAEEHGRREQHAGGHDRPRTDEGGSGEADPHGRGHERRRADVRTAPTARDPRHRREERDGDGRPEDGAPGSADEGGSDRPQRQGEGQKVDEGDRELVGEPARSEPEEDRDERYGEERVVVLVQGPADGVTPLRERRAEPERRARGQVLEDGLVPEIERVLVADVEGGERDGEDRAGREQIGMAENALVGSELRSRAGSGRARVLHAPGWYHEGPCPPPRPCCPVPRRARPPRRTLSRAATRSCWRSSSWPEAFPSGARPSTSTTRSSSLPPRTRRAA